MKNWYFTKQVYNPLSKHLGPDVFRNSDFGRAIRCISRSQWPCGLRRGSAVARFLGSHVRIPPGTWVYLVCVCARVCVCVCGQVQVSATTDHSSGGVLPSVVSLAECETSTMRRHRPTRAVEPWSVGNKLNIPYIT
jgi:hypothetical protein